MDENYLLNTSLSQRLFHECAKNLPIIDYHNHLERKDLTGEKRYRNIAELWLLSDPYKHRAMRICGVREDYITGGAGDKEKFRAWMDILPRLVGNPLYEWSILEMKRVFEIDLKPGITDPEWLWEQTNRKLSKPEYSAQRILQIFNVEYAAPCASIADDITAFEGTGSIAPSLRGDTIADLNAETIEQLERIVETPIFSLYDYCQAIRVRLNDFHRAGCRFSDHALDDGFEYIPDDGRNEQRFITWKQGASLNFDEKKRLSSEILRFLSGEYAKYGWTMQLHIGAQRYTSTRLRKLAGPAGGFAGIGNCCDIRSLTQMLDEFEQGANGMPKMILFTLNPADNAAMSVLSGSYSGDGVEGNVQQGPAWWWCDHLNGMREVLETISSFGVLSTFVGMTTDSRSILSFVRHEYFRRVLCGWLGGKAANGEITASYEALRKLVEDICYYNAKKRITE